MLLVEAGVKKCSLIFARQEQLNEYLAYCENRQLKLKVGNFKSVQVGSGSYKFHSKLAPLEDPRKGMLSLYISRDGETARRAAETMGHSFENSVRFDRLQGEYLGYPGCCNEHFVNVYDRWKGTTTPSMLLGHYRKEKGGAFNFVMNVFRRFLGESILSHYPCRLGCPESVRLGGTYLEGLQKVAPKMAKQLKRESLMSIAFCPDVGIWAFKPVRSKTSRFPPIARQCHRLGNTPHQWIFGERVFVKDVEEGILFSNYKGEELLLDGVVFHFNE